MANRWHAATAATAAASSTSALVPVVPTGGIAQSKIKVEAPEKFGGDPKALSNFLFTVSLYADVMGIPESTEKVKLAVTLLKDRALT